MRYFKVKKLIQYTEVYYVEANVEKEAVDNCEGIEPIVLNDDTWMDSEVYEMTKEEYEKVGTE